MLTLLNINLFEISTDFFELDTEHATGMFPKNDNQCCLLQMVRNLLSPCRLHTCLHHRARAHCTGGQ